MNKRFAFLGISALAMLAFTGCVNDAAGKPVSVDLTSRPGEVRISDSLGGSLRLNVASLTTALTTLGVQGAVTTTTTNPPVAQVPTTPAAPVNPAAVPAGAAPAQTQTAIDPAAWALQKCAWLKANFPQETGAIQTLGVSLAGVPKERIRAGEKFRCSTTTAESVFQGFVVLGPNEGYHGTFTLAVPAHGAVDAYSVPCGAKYTGNFKLVAGGQPNPCDDTYRASDGTVTALSATYYPWNDADPPVKQAPPFNSQAVPVPSSPVSPTTPVSPTAPIDATKSGTNADCKTGKALADERGWLVLPTQSTEVTKFGGAQIEVKAGKEGNLPNGWEAKTSGPDLKGGDLLTPGFYSIYPPHGACRQQLNVQGRAHYGDSVVPFQFAEQEQLVA